LAESRTYRVHRQPSSSVAAYTGKRTRTLINKKLFALQFGFEKNWASKQNLNLITHSNQVFKAHALIHRSIRNTRPSLENKQNTMPL
jgi:hypothetical protein